MPRKTFTFDGKRYDVTAATEQDLAVKIAMRKRDLEEGRVVIGGNMTVKQWSKQWMSTYKKGVIGDAWLSSMQSIIDTAILPQIGHLRMKDVRSIHIQKVLNLCAGKSQSYIHKVATILKEIFSVARKNKIILDDPTETMAPPTGTVNKRRAITSTERKYILQLAEKHRAGLFLKIILYCGLRPGEVAALMWKDVDIEKQTIKIERALKRDGKIGKPKSAAGIRKVPIPMILINDLRPAGPFDNVCTQVSGRPHTATSIRQMWLSFVYRLNIEMGCKTFKGGLIPPYRVADDLVMYCLRHTYCTDLQAAGIPINVARELMGHSTIAMTAQIYTHGSEESFESAAEALNVLCGNRCGSKAEKR